MYKVSLAMFVIQGLVGPKPRPKGVGDGHPVNIPELLINRYQLWGELSGDSVNSIGRVSTSKLANIGKSVLAISRLRV